MTIASGTIIDDRYELLTAIGSGGFGMVYKARQIQLDRMVALKMLDIVENNEALARFEREAAALNLLKQRNIVRFYGYGVWRNAPYMVMEYLPGASLQQAL